MRHLDNRLNVFLILILSIVFVSCEPMNSRNNAGNQTNLKVENLESEISQVKNARYEEQVAIMQYILFVDSLEKKMNSIQSNYTLLINNQELRTNDRKVQLLNRLNLVQRKIDEDKKRISALENKIVRLQENDKSSALLTIINKYKKERKQMESNVRNLHAQVYNLQETIIEKEATIEKQNSVIVTQQTTIKYQDKTIAAQQASLNARYALLIGKDKFCRLEIHNNQLVIPQRRSRVKVLNDYQNNCRLEKIDRSQSLLMINSRLWNDTKYLVIEVKGDF